MQVAKTFLGVAVVKDGKIIDFLKFKMNPGAVAEKMSSTCEEEKKLLQKYKGAKIGQVDIEAVAEHLDIKKDKLAEFIRAVNTELTIIKMRHGLSGKDLLLIQAVRMHKHLLESINLLTESLHEWHSINFPELYDLVKDNSLYIEVISKIGVKEDAQKLELSSEKLEKAIKEVAGHSAGAKIAERDALLLENQAKFIIQMVSNANDLELYVDELISEVAPNIRAVATPLLGARLIDEAGSLEKLASLPASTIQVLGATSAMFRFMKTRKNPPKYGILFNHPLVSQAPKKHKGKIARSVAAKIAIAAKVDLNKGAFLGDRLYRELEQRVENLKE